MKLLFAGLVLIACSSGDVAAQDPVKWTLGTPRTLTVAPGSVVPVKITAKIENGWKVYSLTQTKGGPFGMTITMIPGSRAAFSGPVVAPVPVASYDSSFKMMTETYTGLSNFTIPLKAPTVPGSYSSTIKIRYQACSARFCLPPKNALFQLTFDVKEGK
jgi:thiol:disulfide interchange protein DsbD